MDGDVSDVRAESVILLQARDECGGSLRGRTQYRGAAIAHQMDMHVLINGVVGRRPMANVRMGHESYVFEYLKGAVDRREIYPTRGALNFGEDFFRGSMSQRIDRFKDKLALRRDPKTSITQTGRPVLTHSTIARWRVAAR